ncbi:MAG: HTH-like domain-containing protein [Pseudohongiellaceae bacterium]
MNNAKIFKRIKGALDRAEVGGRRSSAEVRIQAIKYADELEGISGKEFCEGANIPESYGVEFNKMRKIAPRLKRAGLDVTKL